MNLQEFLNKSNVAGIEKSVTISKRLTDPDTGELFKFKIRALSSKEYENARNMATRMPKRKNESVQVDNVIYYTQLILAGCIEPNFKDAQSIAELNCVSPEEYINRVLLPGEIIDLSTAIVRLSGFDEDMSALVEEAKN